SGGPLANLAKMTLWASQPCLFDLFGDERRPPATFVATPKEGWHADLARRNLESQRAGTVPVAWQSGQVTTFIASSADPSAVMVTPTEQELTARACSLCPGGT